MYLNKLCLPYVTVLHLGKEKSSVFLRLYLLMSQLKRSDMLYSLFRFKNHHCIELYMYMRKVLKNWKRLVASCFSLRSTCFAKCRFLNLDILHLRCFIPCLGYRTVVTLDMFISVHDYSFRFVSFRFVSQNTVSPCLQCKITQITMMRGQYYFNWNLRSLSVCFCSCEDSRVPPLHLYYDISIAVDLHCLKAVDRNFVRNGGTTRTHTSLCSWAGVS